MFGILLDGLHYLFDGAFQLRVMTLHNLIGGIIHFNIRRHAVVLDHPLAVQPVDGEFRPGDIGVTFPMAGKAKVTGGGAHPFYAWARDKVGFIGSPKWNFHKYLIAPDGSLADWFSTPTKPTSDKIKRAIEKVLPKTP